MKGAVITVSDRCSKGERQDAGGPLVRDFLQAAGVEVAPPFVVPDEMELIAGAVREALTAVGRGVLILTGGTGLAPRDVTPEAVAPFIDRELPGIMEAYRRMGLLKTPHAILTRGVAGLAGEALVVTLPGSPKALRDAFPILEPLIRSWQEGGKEVY